MRRTFGWLVVASVAITGACSTPAPDAAATPTSNAPPPQAPKFNLEITAVTPERLNRSGRRFVTSTRLAFVEP